MRTARILWVLTGLFCLRVLGQVLVEFLGVDFLPPSEEWFSGVMPYPPLLASQILILLLMATIGRDFSRRSGWSYRPRRLAGSLLLAFGGVYLLAMVIRYAVRMSLYPHERWTGGSIPIVFHGVLATYVLTLGVHHRRQGGRAELAGPRGRLRRWATRLAWVTGAGVTVAALSLWVSYLLLPTLLATSLGVRPPEFAVRIQGGVSFTTSDGTRLVADVYHPRRAGAKTPTVLVRLPYSKDAAYTLFAQTVGRMWAERGYTVVIQGTRGRYESGGTHYPLRDERRDGVETLEWLSRQPWYDGRLGMWGGSYFGYTQWVLGDCADPGPACLLVAEASSDCHGMFYPGGAFSLQTALWWAATSRGRENVYPSPRELADGYRGFTLIEADDRAVGDTAVFNDWASHPDRDDYWARVDGTDRAGRLKAPALLMAGWYDPFLPTQLNDYARVRRGAEPRVAAETRLVIGPWAHAQTVDFPDGTRPRHFRLEGLAPSVAWFDRHLLGRETPALAPVRLYTTGTHRWRDEQEWPLARTKHTPYYLHGDGKANSAAGDGTLAPDAAAPRQRRDTFAYDPRDPVPTAGGAMLGPDAGPRPQRSVEGRPDVLVYTTGPLADDLEVTGPVTLVLHVSTTAPNTDFTGKLVDVYPDGSAYNVSDGILRRGYQQPAGALVPTEITIDLWPTSNVFLKGHRIRLEVSSSNYPRFDRNPNTGRPVAAQTEPLTATQCVWHGATTPSRLILPVIPKP